VSYDLVLWKPKKRSGRSRGAVYLCLVEGVPCDGAARFPRARFVRALLGAFGDNPPFELDAQDTHAHVTVPSGAAGADLLKAVEQLAAAEALVVYDPQMETPTDEDAALAQRLASEAVPECEEPTFEDDLREAEKGDPAAMNNVATRYFSGDGVTKDVAESLLWYRRAADQGFVIAVLNLADCYRKGEGVDKDGVEAVRWYEKALETEQCVSAFALGEMYAEGDAVETSIDDAERYFTLARANRHPDAYRALKKIGRTPLD
jgi:TPR repeat protein